MTKSDSLQLMKNGADQGLIDMKTEALSKTIVNIKKSQMNSARLDMFSEKIDEAHTQQRIGANMVNVTKALGRVTKTMQLEQVSLMAARRHHCISNTAIIRLSRS